MDVYTHMWVGTYTSVSRSEHVGLCKPVVYQLSMQDKHVFESAK